MVQHLETPGIDFASVLEKATHYSAICYMYPYMLKGFLALNDFCHSKTYNIISVNVIFSLRLFPMGDIQ